MNTQTLTLLFACTIFQLSIFPLRSSAAVETNAVDDDLVSIAIDGTYSIWQEETSEGRQVTRFRFTIDTDYDLADESSTLFFQFSVDLYDGDRYIGTHCRWDRRLNGMPDEMLFSLLGSDEHYTVEVGWRAVLTVRLIDTAWASRYETETARSRWFMAAWWRFNSALPENDRDIRYILSADSGLPDFLAFLKQSDVPINAVLTFNGESTISELEDDRE